MIASSFRTRGVMFAFLFGPPRFVRKEEVYSIHQSVCDSLKCEDLSFQYNCDPESTRNPGSQAFSIRFQRREGQGSTLILIDNPDIHHPIRMLLRYDLLPMHFVEETIDVTARAVLGTLKGDWRKVLAEVRLRAQCDTRGGSNAVNYIKESLLKFPKKWFDSFSTPVSFVSTKIEASASWHGDDPLANPKRELLIEVLREDPHCIYLELLSQWPQIPQSPSPVSTIDPGRVRTFDAEPSSYVNNAYQFLSEQLKILEQKGVED